MQDRTATSAATSHASYERTYWRRTNEPAPWWPWGLLPLLGLLALFLYGIWKIAPDMQEDTEGRVRATLEGGDIDVLEVNGDGQIVNIMAAAPKSDEVGIRGLAALTECDTWAGDLRCPTEVNLILQKSEESSVVVPATRFHDFEISRSEDTVTLTGEVASAAVRANLVREAESRFDNVIDELVISSDVATNGYDPASDRALSLLQNFERGNVRWRQGVLSATGWVQAADDGPSRALFNRENAAMSLGSINLNVIASVSSCNEDFASLLSKASIRFRTSSAVIDESSQTLLGELATVAKKCPGQLVIEGHTDNVGGDDPNQRLSLNRAQAVSQALASLGVTPTRLKSVGHGESKPIASNDTPQSRAQNRRIAIRIEE